MYYAGTLTTLTNAHNTYYPSLLPLLPALPDKCLQSITREFHPNARALASSCTPYDPVRNKMVRALRVIRSSWGSGDIWVTRVIRVIRVIKAVTTHCCRSPSLHVRRAEQSSTPTNSTPLHTQLPLTTITTLTSPSYIS